MAQSFSISGKLYIMKLIQYCLIMVAASIVACSCGTRGENMGESTPIDSTNVYGTAPATYGGEDPASQLDTNVADTGTKANNIHNTGHDNPTPAPTEAPGEKK